MALWLTARREGGNPEKWAWITAFVGGDGSDVSTCWWGAVPREKSFLVVFFGQVWTKNRHPKDVLPDDRSLVML